MSSNLRVVTAVSLSLLVVMWLWVGAAAVHASPASTEPSITASAGGVEFVNVTVTDALVFTVSPDEVTPGDSVHVIVTQLGTSDHTFTLSPTAGYTFPDSDVSSDLDAYFSAHTPLVNVLVGTVTGAKYYGNFTAPAFGLYEYVCTEPGHFPSMQGELGSGEAGSSTTVNTGPGAAVFIIVGTITALVIIALVLGFVVGQRRGSREEMPPERLGYPEQVVPPPKP